jgi:hypothetical protein
MQAVRQKTATLRLLLPPAQLMTKSFLPDQRVVVVVEAEVEEAQEAVTKNLKIWQKLKKILH